MRIVFVNQVGQVGGAEMILLDLLASLPAAIPGVERHLIVLSDGPLIGRAETLGVTVHAYPMPSKLAMLGDSALKGKGKGRLAVVLATRGLPAGLAAIGHARGLGRLIREGKPDLIHSNGLKAHLLLSLAGLWGIPIVWQLQDFLGSRPVMARALRWASRSAAGVIAIAEAVGRDAREVLDPLPVEVVYTAIDLDEFTPGVGDGPWLDGLAGLPTAEPGVARVGLVAVYARWKGQDLLLEAAAKIAASRPDAKVRFFIIGGPIYKTQGSQFTEAELRAQAATLGLGDRVGFVPFRRDTANVYRALDVVVHASTQPEPFGRTIVEAMACARPVIVSDAGGASETFTQDVDAVGFPPGDRDALASAILGLLDDPARRDRIALEARRSAASRFARPRFGAEMAAAYARLMKSDRPAPASSPIGA